MLYICTSRTFYCLAHNAMTTTATLAEMEAALINIGFFVGGLTDEAIAYYYRTLIA